MCVGATEKSAVRALFRAARPQLPDYSARGLALRKNPKLANLAPWARMLPHRLRPAPVAPASIGFEERFFEVGHGAAVRDSSDFVRGPFSRSERGPRVVAAGSDGRHLLIARACGCMNVRKRRTEE